MRKAQIDAVDGSENRSYYTILSIFCLLTSGLLFPYPIPTNDFKIAYELNHSNLWSFLSVDLVRSVCRLGIKGAFRIEV